MLRALLDCLTCMANPHFLGLVAPWNKVNEAGQTPWQNDLVISKRGGNNNYTSDSTWENEILKFTNPISDTGKNFRLVVDPNQESTAIPGKTAWEDAMLRYTELPPTSNTTSSSKGHKRAQYNVIVTTPGYVPAETQEAGSASVEPSNAVPYGSPEIYKSTEGGLISRQSSKLFPKAIITSFSRGDSISSEMQPLPNPPYFKEAKRSWPEPREKHERRMTAANYAAVEIHGFFGLIDDGSDGAGRMLVVHVPKWVKGFFLDIKQGDTVHVYHAKGLKIGGALTVLSTGRHKYYGPGRRVTTCTICVPEDEWAPFASYV